MVEARQAGTVKWFGGGDKNFGFIVPDDGGADLFVHRAAVLSGAIRENDRVTFVARPHQKGWRAYAVMKINEGEQQ